MKTRKKTKNHEDTPPQNSTEDPALDVSQPPETATVEKVIFVNPFLWIFH